MHTIACKVGVGSNFGEFCGYVLCEWLHPLFSLSETNFPGGNECGWLSSSQNVLVVIDSGLTFSPGAIEINSFSHDAFTKAVSVALHLYVSRGFLLNAMFELLTLSSIVESIESKMSEIRLLVVSIF